MELEGVWLSAVIGSVFFIVLLTAFWLYDKYKGRKGDRHNNDLAE